MPKQGLHVSVFRRAERNSTPQNSSVRVSDRFDQFTLIGPGVSGPFEPDAESPALILVKEMRAGSLIVYAAPCGEDGKPKRLPFGGNFIFSHDGRFSQAVGTLAAIPIYDWEGG